MITRSCLVYEQGAVRDVTGTAIRPGGLALTEYALDCCSLAPDSKVLDVGCGAAATVEYLHHTRSVRAIGLDASHRLLNDGQQRSPDLPLVQAVGERLPFAGCCFDVLLAECCLSLMSDICQVLAEFYRVLRPGGTLIISDIYARQPDLIPQARRLPLSCCLRSALAEDDLRVQLAACGFTITLWEDHTAALRQLTGEIIFAHGSLTHFWRTVVGEDAAANVINETLVCLKPGYFLLLANKNQNRN